MKVKMVDVARHLGVSKATVSLAVNNRPGVSSETRQKILECIEELGRNGGSFPQEPDFKAEAAVQSHPQAEKERLVEVVIINHRKQVVCDPELDLWSAVLAAFNAEARKRGYLYGLTYLNEGEEDAVVEECNKELVAGVILFGTEMLPEDYGILDRIRKPVVLYDYEMPDGSFSSVCIDNAGAVRMALEYLYRQGAAHICCLCTSKSIYNFEKRREAFLSAWLERDVMPRKEDVIELGSTIGEITENALEWLQHHGLPDAFLCENYQVSIGIAAALHKCRIPVPERVRIVGIDEVPAYMLSGVDVAQIRIPHAERAAMAMDLLDKEISECWTAKIKVFAEPELIAARK